MKKSFTIALLAIMISPAFAFAETSDYGASVDSSATVTTETGLSPQKQKREPSIVARLKAKAKERKQQKQGTVSAASAVALTADQISCIGTSMDTRDAAEKKAHTDGAVMINDAITARNEDLKAALSMTGEARVKAQSEARTTFRDMVKKTHEWTQKAVRMAGDTHRTTVKETCKVTVPDQTAGEPVVDVQVVAEASTSR